MEKESTKCYRITDKAIEKVFPFYFTMDRSLLIRSVGKSMLKLFPEMGNSGKFSEYWYFKRPSAPDISSSEFENYTDKLVAICNLSSSDLVFKGHFQLLDHDTYIWLGTPAFHTIDELTKYQLTTNDFAFNDSLIDLLHVLRNNEIANTELKELVQKFNQQKKELAKEKQNLERKEKMLYALTQATDKLLSTADILDAIQFSLRSIGDALDIDRTFLYQIKRKEEEEVFAVLKSFWCPPCGRSNYENLKPSDIVPKVVLSEILPILEEWSPYETATSEIVDSKALKSLLEQQGVATILLIPVFHKGALWGFLGYENFDPTRVWARDERRLLESFSNSITTALEKQAYARELHDMALFPMENPDPRLRINRNGDIVLQNKPACEIKGPQVNGKTLTIKELTHLIASKVNQVQREYHLEMENNGHNYLVNAKLTSNGEHINIYFNDITQLKQAEKVIQKANEQLVLFKNLINGSSDGVQVAHEDGRLFYINQVASERLGIAMDTVKEYRVHDFEQVFQQPLAWEKHVAELKRVDFLTMEGQNINQITGRNIPVEVTVKYILIGTKGYILASSRDISERKHNERQLKLQEEKYRNIISNMNLGLLEVDNDDIIQFGNQSFEMISGYKFNEILGKKASSIFMNPNEENFIDEKNKIRKTGISDSYEIKARTKSGEDRWWLVSGAPNYNDQGEIIGSIGIHLDITEQKQLEADLEIALQKSQEASQAKEAFLANMSHEIRTPLNGIIGMIRQLKKEKLTPSQRSYILSAGKATQHLLSIVNNILDIAKIEAGELNLDPRPFSFQQLLDDIDSILGAQAREKKIDFNLQVDPEVAPALLGDEARLRQILINLAGNALKFTREGFVRIKCKSKKQVGNQQHIRLTIEDSGVGMSRKYVKNIFQKFHQEDVSISRRFGGTGLGLVITKELIELMQGEISLWSEKGKGTRIQIDLVLPVADPAMLEVREQYKQPPSLPYTRILLVEDNEMNRMVASNTLKLMKVQISEAENGKEALQLLRKEAFDLILMDIQMPVMNGMEATQYIRQEMQLEIPIIALSANAFKSEIDACKANGFNDYITKPFEESELIQLIVKYCQVEVAADRTQPKVILREESDRLYNLEQLRLIAGDDEEFIQNMLEIFVATAPDSIAQMKAARLKSDLKTIRFLAHKLRPSIKYLGIHSILEEMNNLEHFDPEVQSDQELEQKLQYVDQVVTAVIKQLHTHHMLSGNHS